VADYDNLCESAMLAARGVSWKHDVQQYMLDMLRNCLHAKQDLLNGKDIKRGSVEFDIYERGKLRHISAVRFSERVVQKSLSRNVLTKSLWPTMTPGCSANITCRGTDYAIRRLKRQLAAYRKKHGPSGYILLIDFKDYFGSVDHETAKRHITENVDDLGALSLTFDQLDSNSDKGLALGSEPNQTIAVSLPSAIDHMLESYPGIKASGRYMDDSYAIAPSKETLRSVLLEARRICAELNLDVNEKKTHIVKLSRGFVFLKKRFRYEKHGRVTVRPCRSSIARARRRLRKLGAMVKDGVIDRDSFEESYQSTRGQWKKLDAHRTLMEFDRLHRELVKSFDKGGDEQ